jgi:hypothetical protein
MPRLKPTDMGTTIHQLQDQGRLGVSRTCSNSKTPEETEQQKFWANLDWGRPQNVVSLVTPLALVPCAVKNSRPSTSFFLFNCFPQSMAEASLVGCLEALSASIPTREFFEMLFAGPPKPPATCSQATAMQKLGAEITTRLKLDSWYYKMALKDFERSTCLVVELSRKAADLDARSIAVFIPLQKIFTALAGATDSPQALTKRLHFLRVCCHPDKYSRNAVAFAEENSRLKLRMEIVFKSFGQLLDVIKENQKFAERLCCSPSKFHIKGQDVGAAITGLTVAGIASFAAAMGYLATNFFRKVN